MSQIIANVNGKPITQAELDNSIQGFSMGLLRKTMDQLSPEELEEMKGMAMEKLVARQLIYQEAGAQGVSVEDSAVMDEVRKVAENFPTQEEMYSTLEKAGISKEEYEEMLRTDLTVNEMTKRKVASAPEPTAAEVSSFYNEHKDKMVDSGEVRASHILVKTGELSREDALKKTLELKERAASEDFAALARDHSDCPSGHKGGDLGNFGKGQMVKPFEEAAFSLPVGDVSDPVETQFGFHLIKVAEKKEASEVSFEEATPRIIQFLKERRESKMLSDWVAELRKTAEIEIL